MHAKLVYVRNLKRSVKDGVRRGGGGGAWHSQKAQKTAENFTLNVTIMQHCVAGVACRRRSRKKQRERVMTPRGALERRPKGALKMEMATLTVTGNGTSG